MLKLKYLSRFSYLFLVAFVAIMAISAPTKLLAQDDMPSDETSIMPSSGNSSPPIIDETDAGSVSDVEEYDG
ncbi:MAG: hypothetical protein Q7U04_04165 [Bacteriovorax sp.]|nr:hypothetical protein [Bacteriovorax sp.]